ncbi:MAG: ArnT family glycosyltransferase, partial [Anaerolineae bacterium]
STIASCRHALALNLLHTEAAWWERSSLTRQMLRPAGSLLTHYLLTGLLLVAAVLRLAALPNVPPGVEHDEVAEVLIAEAILDGQHAIFFREAYGQEPLFLYLVAGSLALIGHNVLALRFVTASIGILTVAAGARWARRLFGRRVAVVTAAGLGVMLWSVFWSRVGLRGMSLPLMMALGADGLWAALRGERSRRWRRATLAGFWFGASAYTYLAARGVPLILIGWGGLLWLLDRGRFRDRWRAFLVACVIAAVVAAPLFFYLFGNKSAQSRVYQVDAPLRALQAGDFGPILANVPRVAGMFTFAGDETVRNNLPGRPVFPEPISAALFYVGLAVALLRFRDVRYSLVLLWLGVMLVPSLVTIEAPNFVRTLGALPVTMVLVGIGADAALQWLAERDGAVRGLGAAVLAIALAANVALTAQAYFEDWPQHPEVQFVWQLDLAAVADWLDRHPEVEDVTVAGLSNASMDDPTLDLLMRRSDVRGRWCDVGSPQSSAGAVLMAAGGGRLLVPEIVPFDDTLASHLESFVDFDISAHQRFREFRLTDPPAHGELDVGFTGGVTLLDIVRVDDASPALITRWRSESDDHPDLKVAVHLLDSEGEVQAQHDGLDCPARFWRTGDQILQLHRISLAEPATPGRYTVRVSLYDRQTLAPYPLLDGQPYYEAGSIDVGAP